MGYQTGNEKLPWVCLRLLLVQGQMLAGLLSWPQATFASKVELDKAAGAVQVGVWVVGGGLSGTQLVGVLWRRGEVVSSRLLLGSAGRTCTFKKHCWASEPSTTTTAVNAPLLLAGSTPPGAGMPQDVWGHAGWAGACAAVASVTTWRMLSIRHQFVPGVMTKR
jgi:hypothetical protein